MEICEAIDYCNFLLIRHNFSVRSAFLIDPLARLRLQNLLDSLWTCIAMLILFENKHDIFHLCASWESCHVMYVKNQL